MNSFELIPTKENLLKTLEEDILERNKELVYFYDLLMAQETASAIAIDGRWGSGKTFFVKQMLLLLNARNKRYQMDDDERKRILSYVPFKPKKDEEDDNCFLSIYYDAWENDNDMEPILSIVYEITKQLSLDYSFDSNCSIFKLSVTILETISRRNIHGIIDELKGDDPLAKFKQQKDFSENIKSFFTQLLEERGKRLVIFIDELDRCKPSYAVKLLEQIKHYLCDERVTFVFSINLQELQYTIKHYYGDSFDAYRYLDRFFDIRISVPPSNKDKFCNKLGLNSAYCLEKVCKHFAKNYNMELREITRYYRQVKTAAYVATHESTSFDFSFEDGKAKHMIIMYIVPIIIGLRIVNISMYDEFVNGKNIKPLTDILLNEEIAHYFFRKLLNNDESFHKEDNKKIVTKEQKINDIYEAIFVKEYSGAEYCKYIGEYEFDNNSKIFALNVANMLSVYADYNI